MPIKIKKKTTPSNEPNTGLKSEGETQGKAEEGSNQSIEGAAPFIDKISVVMDVPAEDVYDSYGSLFTYVKDSTVFKSTSPANSFNRAWRIALNCIENSKKWPLLMVAFDKEMKALLKFRIEFSPVDLGTKGMGELHTVLIEVMDSGWGAFVKHGRVTMIEITVDLPNIGVDQFDALPKQSAYKQAWVKEGHLETIVFGKASGNQTKIYNRGKKRTDKGQKWLGPVTTGVERRC